MATQTISGAKSLEQKANDVRKMRAMNEEISKLKRIVADEPLKEAIVKVLELKTYFGLPRVVENLRDKQGFKDNHKRIGRVYRELGLQIHKRKRKVRRSRPRLALPAPTRPNELWAMDFVSDSFATGRRFRTLNIKDLFTHEAVMRSC